MVSESTVPPPSSPSPSSRCSSGRGITKPSPLSPSTATPKGWGASHCQKVGAMESVIAWALEDKLGYWIKCFSRKKLKLRGRTAQLSNVEIDGDALHAALGLPPALVVATAHIQELVITLPSLLNMQLEPTVVSIDRLDIVLEAKGEMKHHSSPNSYLPSPSSTKDSGHGYADKITDGMTVKVGTMNLLIKTHGVAPCEGGITGPTPLASITVYGLMLYTTNEKWKVVSLKEARNFSDDRELIYVFKKVEWQSVTVDLKPHVNNSADMKLNSSIGQYSVQDGGAIRMPYVGERVFEGKYGEANITIQRTEQKDLLGLEFQVHIIEVLSPALSEHGLLTLLSFITSLCVVLSRRAADPGQKHVEAARSFSVSILVDHIYLCIKDIELQLELLMKPLFFSRASIPDGDNCKILSCMKVGELVLRDTFVEPSCTLIEPSKQVVRRESSPVPEFGQFFCSIYPFGNQLLDSTNGYPLLSVYSLQITPSPLPPMFSVETVITCNPLTMNFQEQSCLRISTILANGDVKKFCGALSPDSAIRSLTFSVQEFDLSAGLIPEEVSKWYRPENSCSQSFPVVRLHVDNLYFCLSPSVNCTLLSLEKDPTCSLLWEHQPIHASKRKWVTQASYVALEIFTTLQEQETTNTGFGIRPNGMSIDFPVFVVAMVTTDGSPLSRVPPPECIVRIGIHFRHCILSIMAEELFFLLAVCSYFGPLLEQILNANINSLSNRESSVEKLVKGWPSNTVMNFSLDYLDFNLLQSSPIYSRISRRVHLGGSFLFLKVSHRTVGSTFEVTTSLQWKEATVHCFNLEGPSDHVGGIGSVGDYDIFTEEEELPVKRPMFWVDSQSNYQDSQAQFLDITIAYITPYLAQDVECCKLKFATKISGVRLGGGTRHTEYVLQRLGIMPDGCPGKVLLEGIINSFSRPLAKLLKLYTITDKDDVSSKEGDESEFGMGMPYGVDVSVELRDWIFALEGTEEIGDWACRRTCNRIPREVKFWQAAIRNLHLRGKHSGRTKLNSAEKASQKTEYPFECFTSQARVEGLQAIRPHLRNPATGNGTAQRHQAGSTLVSSDQGTDIEATMVTSQDGTGVSEWTVDKTRFSVEDLVTGAVLTKEEHEYLSALCKSEADSLGRIAAAVLRLLELDGSHGQAAIDQLASLGSELARIFTPEKLNTK